MNAYLADHRGADASFEYAVLGLQNPDYEIEPWTPADSVAWLKAMAWDLRSNIEIETERAIAAADFSSDELAQLYPAYPFDRNPVIVPTISTLPAVGTARFADDSDARGGRQRPRPIEWSRGRRGHRGRERARRRRRRGHRLELVGRLGRAHRERDAAARQRSAPRRVAAERVAPDRPEVPRGLDGVRRSTSRASASRASPASSSATTTASRGASPTSRPTSPTSTSRRSTATPTGATARSSRSTSAPRPSRSPAARTSSSSSARPATARSSRG